MIATVPLALGRGLYQPRQLLARGFFAPGIKAVLRWNPGARGGF